MNYNIEFVTFDTEFLDKSYIWLSDPEIKRLTQTPSINKEEQARWYESLRLLTNYFVRGIRADGMAIGAIGLKKINYTNHTAEYFGYIGEKEFWGKGIGRVMMCFVEEYAERLDIGTIFLKVISENIRALSLYKNCGYVEYVTDGDLILMKKELSSHIHCTRNEDF